MTGIMPNNALTGNAGGGVPVPYRSHISGVPELNRLAECTHEQDMPLKINFNDAWELIPLQCADDLIDFLRRELQPAHPLRAFKLFPLAKCWRKDKYLLEEEEPSDLLWVLDLHRKKRIKGKTVYYFKQMMTQEELDAVLQSDYEAWVQYMKDAGAWHGG